MYRAYSQVKLTSQLLARLRVPSQINQACRNPVDLDMKQANAVLARTDLDLRLGAAFTRYQTLGLQARFGALNDKVVSYGELDM